MSSRSLPAVRIGRGGPDAARPPAHVLDVHAHADGADLGVRESLRRRSSAGIATVVVRASPRIYATVGIQPWTAPARRDEHRRESVRAVLPRAVVGELDTVRTRLGTSVIARMLLGVHDRPLRPFRRPSAALSRSWPLDESRRPARDSRMSARLLRWTSAPGFAHTARAAARATPIGRRVTRDAPSSRRVRDPSSRGRDRPTRRRFA